MYTNISTSSLTALLASHFEWMEADAIGSNVILTFKSLYILESVEMFQGQEAQLSCL